MDKIIKSKTFEEFNISIVDEKKDYGKFIIKPLERGFGNTIGNAIRRILLSNLSGAAIFAAEIDGVRHEFSVIDGVVEDTMHILLNLKNVILKINDDSEETKILKINKTGPCTIYAKDIECPELVDIINPDLEIAHLTDNGKLHMTLFACLGRGYVTAESNKMNNENQKINYISMDANYSPIVKVNYFVEPIIILHNLKFDELTFEIWTNGSVNAKKALISASNILVAYLNKMVKLIENSKEVNNEIKFENTISENDELINDNVVDEDDFSNKPIEDLDLSIRSFNCLKKNGITTIRELISKNKNEISNIDNLGRKSFEEIEQKLAKKNFFLKEK